MDWKPEDIEPFATPSTAASIIWKQTPYRWQTHPMDDLMVDGNRVAVATCNASGKTSWLTARGCLWYMMAFPKCRVITTSASARQVQQQLYPNLRSCIGMLPNAKEWKIRDNNMFYVYAPNGSKLESFATNDAGRAEGYHIPDIPEGIHNREKISDEWWAYLKEHGIEDVEDQGRLLLVIDEAKSVEEDIFQAFERCRGSNWLVVSTPSLDPSGPFYECFTRTKDKFKCKLTGKYNLYGGFEEYGIIDYKVCPHLSEDKNELRNIQLDLKTRGEGDAFVQSMHLGRFPKVGANMVFDMTAVDHCMSGLVAKIGRDRAFCCDFSGGGDAQPFGIREGNQSWIAKSWHEGDAVALAENIVAELRRQGYNPEYDEFIGDNGGIGEACNDILESKGIFVTRFDFRGEVKDKRMYANVRAEGYFELARRVKLGEIILPNSQSLREQLSWHKYEPNDDTRQIKLTSKKKMPHSPDEADVIMMLYYNWHPPTEVSNPMQAELSACRGMIGRTPQSKWHDPSRSEGILF